MLYELLTGELPGKTYAPPSRHPEVEVDPKFDPLVRRALHPAPGPPLCRCSGVLAGTRVPRQGIHKPVRRMDGDSKRAELQTDTDVETKSAATAPIKSVDHSKIVARNIVIIVILLMAVLFTLAAYNRRKNEIERKNSRTAEGEATKDPVPEAPSPARRADPPRLEPTPPADPSPQVNRSPINRSISPA